MVGEIKKVRELSVLLALVELKFYALRNDLCNDVAADSDMRGDKSCEFVVTLVAMTEYNSMLFSTAAIFTGLPRHTMPKLLPDVDLELSDVVTNCRMNRERGLSGSNGYEKELGLSPLTFLKKIAVVQGHASWLDLCCGSGKALIEVAGEIDQETLTEQIQILGVDLISNDNQSSLPGLSFVQASLSNWQPTQQYDLITCVHGLHYLGDKLSLICRTVSWLTDQGKFLASLDLSNMYIRDSTNSIRQIAKALRSAVLEYHTRKKLLTREGQKEITLPYRYLGADDQAGPNYTGQAAVNSHYERM